MNGDLSRSTYGIALIAAGVAIGLGALLLIAILTFGAWGATNYPLIIKTLGQALLGAGVLMTLVIIFLGLGGPARLLKASFGIASIETQGD